MNENNRERHWRQIVLQTYRNAPLALGEYRIFDTRAGRTLYHGRNERRAQAVRAAAIKELERIEAHNTGANT